MHAISCLSALAQGKVFRVWCLWACFLMLEGFLAQGAWAQSGASLPLPPDIQRIESRGALLVAMPAFDSPPFFYQVAGRVEGIDADIARGVAQVLHVPVRFLRQAGSFNEVVDSVARGEADLAVCKLSRTLDRSRLVRFSDPYFVSRHALLLNRVAFARLARGRELADVVRQFDGTLGVIRGSAFADQAAHNFPKARIIGFERWDEVLAALQQGQVVAAYRDEFEMKRLFRQKPTLSLSLRLVALRDTEDSQALALPHDASQLLALVNLYLAQSRLPLSADQVLNYQEVDK